MFIAVIHIDNGDWVELWKLWRIGEVMKLWNRYLIPDKNETWISDKLIFDYAVLWNFMKMKGSSGSEIIPIGHFKRVFWHPFTFKRL